MFIKFESDNRENVVECTEYLLFSGDFEPDDTQPGTIVVDDKVVAQPCKYIKPSESLAEYKYLLFDRPGYWRRAYIMNNDGQTIETIYAPSLPPISLLVPFPSGGEFDGKDDEKIVRPLDSDFGLDK